MTSILSTENPFLKLTTRGLLLAGLIIQALLSVGFAQLVAATNLNFKEPIVIPIFYTLFFGLLSLWELRQFNHFHISLKRLIGRPPREYRWLPTIGLVIMILLFSLSTFTLSFYLLSFAAPQFVNTFLQSTETQLNPETDFPLLYHLLTIGATIIVAPITEEFIFRGVLLHRWAAKWGIQPALILSSLIFGALHLHNVIGLSMFGFVMGLLYIRSRSLLVPIASHAMNNLLATGLGYLPNNSTPDHVNALEQFRSTGWMGLVFLLLSAPWLFRFIRRSWPQPHTLTPYCANTSGH